MNVVVRAGFEDADRIHQVSCSMHSNAGTFDEVEAKANKIAAYARRLGFAVLYDNVDRCDDPLEGPGG